MQVVAETESKLIENLSQTMTSETISPAIVTPITL